jgi:hypothetical protein
MHGKALSYKLSKNERAFMGAISKKPVNVVKKSIESLSFEENSEDCDLKKGNQNWEHFESVT